MIDGKKIGVIQVRAPIRLTEALKEAAERCTISQSAFVRQLLIRELRLDVDPRREVGSDGR